MTELEALRQAKLYIGKMAHGINPITDREIPENDMLNDVKLTRCLFYVSEILDWVIQNGGTAGQPVKSMRFFLAPERRRNVHIPAYPVTITEFTEMLYTAADNKNMKRLNPTRVTDWLQLCGFLTKETAPDGKMQRVPTEFGRKLGITTQQRQSRDREYLAVYYSPDAQRFLLDHLDEILKSK